MPKIKAIRGRGLVLAIASGASLVLGTLVTMAGPSLATMTYQVTNYDNDGTSGVYLRNSANINDVIRDSAHYVTYGTSVNLICAESGSAVGPYNNTAWDYVQVVSGPNAGRYGHLSEHWLNTPVATNQHVSGEPTCGSTSSADGDSVWVGAPFTGHWPNANGCSGATFPSYTCSLPSVHWWLARAPQGDWAADVQGVTPGTAVRLYAAPRDSSVPVTATVDAVGAACRSGLVSDGGYRVTIGLFVRGTRIGSVTYAHINPNVSAGSTINRWGTQIGTVGSGYNTHAGCWSGPHVHFQAYAQTGYSCYNRGYTPGYPLNPTNFLGFVTGRYASGPRQACP